MVKITKTTNIIYFIIVSLLSTYLHNIFNILWLTFINSIRKNLLISVHNKLHFRSYYHTKPQGATESRNMAMAPEGEGCPRCGGFVYMAEQMLAKGRVSAIYLTTILKSQFNYIYIGYIFYRYSRDIIKNVSTVFLATKL